ncbi:MAG TPA: DUF3667 domain-containing protein [Arenimonas sp.]
MVDAGPSCTNCLGAVAAEDAYCRHCGQPVVSVDHRPLRPLVTQSLEEALSLDGRLLQSFWLLVARPGYLSREYQRGRRRRYLSPISLFLLANLVFFLMPGLSDFSVSLLDQVTLQPYSAWVAPQAQQALAASGLPAEAFAADYQARADAIAELLVILHVPLLALVSYLLAFNRRGFLVDHVVATLHFFAFLMLYYAQLPHVLLPLLNGLDALLGGRLPAWQIAVSLQFLYIPIMLRTAFGYAWWRVIPTSVVYLVALYWVHVAYRLIQFELVMAWGPG